MAFPSCLTIPPSTRSPTLLTLLVLEVHPSDTINDVNCLKDPGLKISTRNAHGGEIVCVCTRRGVEALGDGRVFGEGQSHTAT